MTPEKRVQNKIVEYLSTLQDQGYPVFVERRNAGGFSYKKGIPDLYAVINSIHLEIEVKRPGGKLSTMQIKYSEKCNRLGILWICVDNLEDIKKLTEKLLNSRIIYSQI